MQKRPNFTGAVKKIQDHYLRSQGRSPGILVTGEMNGDYAEVFIDGDRRWVLLNGRKALVLRTNI